MTRAARSRIHLHFHNSAGTAELKVAALYSRHTLWPNKTENTQRCLFKTTRC